MSKKRENTGFVCVNCGAGVLPLVEGGYRNHCPVCLCSLHIDIEPGDRACGCLGVMRPVGVEYSSKKGRQIRHRCERCGFERLNVVCWDVNMPDDLEVVRRVEVFGG